jgi:hypothetical protein
VRLAIIENGEIGQPVDVTDGKHNAYDPACCFDKAGNLFVAYASFEGQHVIRAQKFSARGEKDGEALMLSVNQLSCVFPSLCAAANGGIWFSYTCYDDIIHTKAGDHRFSVMQDPRYLAQSTFFQKRGRAYAGLLKNGIISVPPVGSGKGDAPPGAVFPSAGAAHTQIVETGQGRVYLLLRQRSSAKPVNFASADAPLKKRVILSPWANPTVMATWPSACWARKVGKHRCA